MIQCQIVRFNKIKTKYKLNVITIIIPKLAKNQVKKVECRLAMFYTGGRKY